jgi:CubicO group peptidase (beta-lactamase class C family)
MMVLTGEVESCNVAGPLRRSSCVDYQTDTAVWRRGNRLGDFEMARTLRAGLLLFAASTLLEILPSVDAESCASLEEALDTVVPQQLEAGDICGAVIEVGRRKLQGYETWRKAYGLKQFEPNEAPMQVDAVFDMASMTKPIATGTSLMLLEEQGRVALDDPVGKYLPEFNSLDKKNVTIRHLMTHTSGMPPYIGAARQKEIQGEAGFPCPAATRSYIRNLSLARQPGKTVVYSCLNAILCAEVVATVAEQPFDEFAQEHIFGPLGMESTRFNPPAKMQERCVPTTREPHGTGPDGFLLGQVHDPLAAMQAGVSGNAGLFSKAEDLGRFAQMMLNGGTLDGVRILQQQTVREATRVQNPGAVNTRGNPDRRGLLWDLYVPDPGEAGIDALFAYGHTGYSGTALRIYPEHGVYVLVLANRVHPDDSGRVSALRRQVWETVGSQMLKCSVPPRTSASRTDIGVRGGQFHREK